ncbi:hypothetical protein EDD22DRAFT_969086 [Suillus occidentalis]|nr:hypothetical protein EDD22DRAFT_969086 [Suillus occidentalis]
MVQRPPPTVDQQQPIFGRLTKLLRFSHANPVHHDQPRDPLVFSATSPLPHPLSGYTSPQGRSHVNSGENSRSPATPPTTSAVPHTPSIILVARSWRTLRSPASIDIPLAQAKEACSAHFLRNAAAGAPKKDEDIVPNEYLDHSSPNPDSQQPATASQPVSGEHGGGRSCFCF